MKSLNIKYLALVAIVLLTNGHINAQTNEIDINQFQKYYETADVSKSTFGGKLDFAQSNKKIEHVFNITMSKQDSKKLSKVANLEKNYLKDCILTHNGDTLDLLELELRGKSSMEFKRKSFSVKLDSKVRFTKNEKSYKLKKFNLISLNMDQNYYRNKVAFDLMHELGLFNLFYSYAEVVVNGESQGIYLVLQKPKNYAFKKEKSNVMLRRDYGNRIKKTYYKGEDTTLKVNCEEAFNRIYSEILLKEGKRFYNELSEVLDVEQYFTWMAFNYLIGNKDYTDEVFFYNKASGDSIKFGIIPWDYDDIFFDYPHEGHIIRYVNFGDKLAFSSEDDLDYKLITDDYTYNKYLENFEKIFEKISIPVLKEIFELTYQELYPFYCKEEIVNKSKVDKYGKTSLMSLELDMNNNYKKIVQKREEAYNLLEPILTEKKPGYTSKEGSSLESNN